MTTLPEIESRFDVLAKLGEGGMGCVYKVRHRDLDEIQIVKTLQAHLSSNEGLRERFINEARRGMRLRHPHIAGVHDFAVCADGTGYIVMEYVYGLNLRDVLATQGPLPVPLVGTIAVQTLDALAYLHSQKFVHRDISPDNLMLTTEDGQPFVKLIDLGISKSLESGSTITVTGQFLGKVSYASPEQFGGQLDGRSDLYSFGVVLYKLLTNAEAFVGESYKEIITAQLFQPPRPFREVAPNINIPEPIQHVIFRALEKEPDKRYADASEFCAAVEEAFEVHDARPISVVTRPARTASGPLPRTESTTTLVPLTDKTEVSVGPRAAAVAPTQAETLITGVPTIIERRVARVPRRWQIVAAAVAIVLAAALVVVWQQQRLEAARIAGLGKFYAVVIGESQYRKLESLPTAANDAHAVGQLLEQKYGFDVTRLENAEAKDILAALHKTGKRMTDRDNLVIFYAGHGTLKNEKGYWQPVDADFDMSNWISPANIKDVLLDHPSRRTLILADSCYSGALVHGTPSLPSPSGDRNDKPARIVISSGGDAPVIDSADGQHSIFTRALLDVLGSPEHKVTDIQSLFTRIREHVVDSARRAGREQNPQLSAIAEVGDEGGTFFFVAQPKQ
jgi:tRNA A-37 threonylcarbamoyl transferase component Bud32